jgi:hypothetical protein
VVYNRLFKRVSRKKDLLISKVCKRYGLVYGL